MQGVRRDRADGSLPNPGEYGKDGDGKWWGCSPNGHLANLRAHAVEEHGDGTITVTPSILISEVGHDEAKRQLYHGVLTRGVWSDG